MFKKFLVTNNDVFFFYTYFLTAYVHIYKIECPISIQIHALYDSV